MMSKDEMTPKQRLIAAITGKPVDRTPWSPFLAYWWEAQSQSRIEAGQLAYLESIGADPLLRGFGSPFTVSYPGVDITVSSSANRRQELWHTPVGDIQLGYTLSAQGNTWFLVDHPIRESRDFQTLTWIYEHASVAYNPEIDRQITQIGEQGLYLPLVGSEMKTCFQSLVEKWVGIERLSFFLADEPETVEQCLAAMRSVSDKTAVCAAQCKAEAFIFWEDSSTTCITPNMFARYTSPEISAWADILHQNGKLLVHHACGHLRALLPLMAQTGVDAIESISPPTTGNIDIPEAFSLLPEHIALIGGIEPVFFQTCDRQQLEERISFLQKETCGRRFVLANSDSCPPAVDEWKLEYVSEYVRR